MSVRGRIAIVTGAGGGLGRSHAMFLARHGVSPGLLALVGETAPSRSILCAGAGHFETANITLTKGRYIGGGSDAGEQVVHRWDEISNRNGEIVPDYGFMQAEHEIAGAKSETPGSTD